MVFVAKIICIYLLALFACIVLLLLLLQASGGFAFAVPQLAPLAYVPVLILHALQIHIVVAALTGKIGRRWLALPVATYAIAGVLALLSFRAQHDLVVEIEAENAKKVVIPSLPLAFAQASYNISTIVKKYEVPAVYSFVQNIPMAYQPGEGCGPKHLPPERRLCVMHSRADRPAFVVLVDQRVESFSRYLTRAHMTVFRISVIDAGGERPLLRLRVGAVSCFNPLWFGVPDLLWLWWPAGGRRVGSDEVELLAAALSLRRRE